MDDKHENQAAGGDGAAGAPDGTNVAPGTGESAGGGRPGKQGHGDGDHSGFMGHGGQSKNAYHGRGQLGGEATDEDAEPNAATRAS